MQIKQYDNIISLGFFCSTALELERIGLRGNSGPFDWVLSFDISKVIELINNDFKDLLNIRYLKQYKSNPSYYMNYKYDIHFYHDFDEYKKLDDQLEDVSNKYKRRIEKFYENIKSKTLFIRYISSQQECTYIEENLQQIIGALRQYNEKNEIIFISNGDIKSNELKIFYVDPDEGDTVARRFIEKNNELEQYLMSNIYNSQKRKKNIKVYKNKEKKNKILKIPNKVINLIRKNICKVKIYSCIYDK